MKKLVMLFMLILTSVGLLAQPEFNSDTTYWFPIDAPVNHLQVEVSSKPSKVVVSSSAFDENESFKTLIENQTCALNELNATLLEQSPKFSIEEMEERLEYIGISDYNKYNKMNTIGVTIYYCMVTLYIMLLCIINTPGKYEADLPIGTKALSKVLVIVLSLVIFLLIIPDMVKAINWESTVANAIVSHF